ncbi:MAG TPA: DUF6356 family protein [Rhizomicrobium sp.]|nr:DUF6356 family protein [Rhizomicrobium sp.]
MAFGRSNDEHYPIFTAHPSSVGERYVEHMLTALSFGMRMIAAGSACMLHGVLPFLFVRTGSTTVRHLHDEMITHRSRSRAAPEWADMGAHI